MTTGSPKLLPQHPRRIAFVNQSLFPSIDTIHSEDGITHEGEPCVAVSIYESKLIPVQMGVLAQAHTIGRTVNDVCDVANRPIDGVNNR